jgi:hypothetical protein
MEDSSLLSLDGGPCQLELEVEDVNGYSQSEPGEQQSKSAKFQFGFRVIALATSDLA